MHSTAQLTGSHLRTYERIFQHPASHNLSWREVHLMLRAVAQVDEEPNGSLRVSRNGHSLVLHPRHTKDVAESAEVMSLRHFLAQSEPGVAPPGGPTVHWLLVINHHEARLFRSELVGAEPLTLLPHEPEDYFRHAHNSRDFTRGKEKPDPNSFFAPVATALGTVGPILVFGSGTGTSSEMEQFIEWTNAHHPELARRIMGTVVIDESHQTEGQIFALAREYYAKHHTPTL